jgi:T-complex protein 1 subunit alpha
MGIDDIANKYLVSKGIMAVRRIDKAHLRRIAKATGAKVIKTFAN